MGKPLRGHDGRVLSVALSTDGSRIASGGEDGTVRVWDAASGAAVSDPIRGH
jgi:WD40 repeat protein